MTLVSDAEKRVVTLNRLIKDFLGRIELGDRARRKADAAGKVVEMREILRLVQEEVAVKGPTIITFLGTCIKEAERIPARIADQAQRRKLPQERAEKAVASAEKASKKLRDFYRSIQLFLESIVKSFERGIFPGAAIDTLRVYMVKTPDLERSHAEALLADLDQAEAYLYAPVHENAS